MPSRLGILAIVVFWLVSAGWLVVREIMPRFRAGEPPAFFTDLLDEVGGTTINWTILQNGEPIGNGFSRVERRPDRFVLASNLKFVNFAILGVVPLKKIAGEYHVDLEGNLKELSTKVIIGTGPQTDTEGELKGVVLDGMLELNVYLDGKKMVDFGPFQPRPLHVGAHGNVLNTMHLINKIPGLSPGRSWKIPLLDPLEAIPLGQKAAPTTIIAEVHVADLKWQGQPVPCFRIDYSEPGQNPTAHTWVRRRDGLVLQQDAKRDALDLVLVREVSK